MGSQGRSAAQPLESDRANSEPWKGERFFRPSRAPDRYLMTVVSRGCACAPPLATIGRPLRGLQEIDAMYLQQRYLINRALEYVLILQQALSLDRRILANQADTLRFLPSRIVAMNFSFRLENCFMRLRDSSAVSLRREGCCIFSFLAPVAFLGML